MSADTYTAVPATEATCGWLVQVPNGNPEPDFPSDCYDILECGAPLEVNGHGSWRCDSGHHHVSMEDPGWAADDWAFAQWEREQG